MVIVRRWSIALFACLALILFAELGLRAAGATDFPVFRRDPQVGYYPAPDQAGTFLRRNDWAFDSHSLGTERPFVPTRDAVLLVGDSVVYGGNPLRQREKLGPALERKIARPVYPLAAGGWAFGNELRAMRARADLLKVPVIVFVANSGDYGARAQPDDLQFPAERPSSALAYYLRRYVFKPHDVVESPDRAGAAAEWQRDLDWLLATYKGRLIWVFHAKANEIGETIPAAYAPLIERLRGRATIVWAGGDPRWTRAMYRDGSIHPTPAGNDRLATIIADALATGP